MTSWILRFSFFRFDDQETQATKSENQTYYNSSLTLPNTHKLNQSKINILYDDINNFSLLYNTYLETNNTKDFDLDQISINIFSINI